MADPLLLTPIYAISSNSSLPTNFSNHNFYDFFQTYFVTQSQKSVREAKNYFWDFHGGKPSERGVNFLVQIGAYRRRRSAEGLI